MNKMNVIADIILEKECEQFGVTDHFWVVVKIKTPIRYKWKPRRGKELVAIK